MPLSELASDRAALSLSDSRRVSHHSSDLETEMSRRSGNFGDVMLLAAGTSNNAQTTLFTVGGAFVGVLVTSIVALLVGGQKTAADRRAAAAVLAEQRRMALTARASDFLSATYHSVLALRDMALADQAHLSAVEKSEVWPTVDRSNVALTAIEINDHDEVVAAAQTIDQALVVLARDAKSKTWNPEEWRQHRTSTIGTLPQDMTAIVRKHATALQPR